jgi:large subunit ribosomal protein L35
MTKFKIRKAAKKRYKQITVKNFIRKKAFKGHILEKKSAKRKRNLSRSFLVSTSDLKTIQKMLIG